MTSINPTSTKHVNQESSLLNLPSEVRLLIYPYAVQHIVDDIRGKSLQDGRSAPEPQRPAIQGALALLHTSSLLRSESSAALSSLISLEKFQVRRALGRKQLLNMANASVSSPESSDVAGRRDLMRDVRYIIERVDGAVQESKAR